MKVLNDDNFKDVTEGLALVMFSAPWAGPCNLVRPAFEETEGRYGNQIHFGEFSLDDNPETPEHYNVKGVPVFYMLKDGVPQKILTGAVSSNWLMAMCREALEDD